MGVCNFLLVGVLFFYPLGVMSKSIEAEPCIDKQKLESCTFKKSTVALMYNDTNMQHLDDYNVDMITWGGQVENSKSSIKKYKALFEKYDKHGLKLYAANIALIQEGGKYVVCGDKWTLHCNKLFWGLRDGDQSKNAKLVESQAIKERAVVDANDNIVGVPWLKMKGHTIPMACVNDPAYKQWLFNKLDLVLSVNPKVLHFDEPWMDFVSLRSGKKGCFTQHSMDDFSQFINEQHAHDLEDYKNDKFDYKFYVNNEQYNELSNQLSVEYREFKLLSTLKLFSELVHYVKQESISPISVTANVSPANGVKVNFIKFLDFLSPEINHHANKLTISNNPVFVYLMGNAMNLPVFSTAFGNDWAVVKSGKHEVLASAWIAQAYAMGQFMNFPLKAWVPGSSYVPHTNIYSNITKWIKENEQLFDGYEPVYTHTLILSRNILNSISDKRLVKKFLINLIDKGVLFRMFLDDFHYKSEFSDSYFSHDNSFITVLPEYYLNDTNDKLLKIKDKAVSWNPSRVDMKKGEVDSKFVQIELVGEKDVFVFPRIKTGLEKSNIVLHLLNRNYLPERRAMKKKGPFSIKLDKKLFTNHRLESAILHQPKLKGEFYESDVDFPVKLAVKDVQNHFILTIPSLELWGIIEFNFL